MSANETRVTSRRTLLKAVLAAIGLGAAAGAAYEGGLFGPFYPRTPYDDLLAKLPERAAAETVGKAMRDEYKLFDAKAAAKSLRQRLADRSLGDVVTADIETNDLTEVKGWVLPTSLAQLAALTPGST